MHVSGMEDLLIYLASSDTERQFAFHVLEIVSLMFREQVRALSNLTQIWLNVLEFVSVNLSVADDSSKN